MALENYVKNIPGADTGILLCALSGGADSVALLHVLHSSGYRLHAAHVNYGLRGSESDGDEQYCRELCAELHIPLHVHKADPGLKSGNTQQWARDIRYGFFGELDLQFGYAAILTAHQANDAFESMLMNTADGCGPSGFLGIAARNGRYLRPLLHCTRQDTEDYCRQHGLGFRNDSSNAGNAYKRNRIRLGITPQYQELNARAMAHFAASRQRLERALSFYHNAYSEFCAREISYTGFTESLLLKNELQLFYMEWLAAKGFNSLMATDILSGKYRKGEWHSRLGRLLLHEGQLIFSSGGAHNNPAGLLLNGPGSYVYENYHIEVSLSAYTTMPAFGNPMLFYADAGILRFPLLLRPVQTGDSMQPLGMKGHKKISDILTDKKINRFDKEMALVLCSGKDIAWLCGYTVSEKFRLSSGSQQMLEIRLTPRHQEPETGTASR